MSTHDAPDEQIVGQRYLLEIWRDSDPPNPRVEFDNLGTMVCWHSRYTLGDPNELRQNERPEEYFERKVRELDPAIDNALYWWDEEAPFAPVYRQVKRAQCLLRALTTHFVKLPVYLYDHSGITISTTPFSCHWDSGQIGYIYVDIANAKAEFGWKRLTAKRIARLQTYLNNEVEIYDQYLTGEVYGFVLHERTTCPYCDDSGKIKDLPCPSCKGQPVYEQIDSCFGFFGDKISENGITDHLDPAVRQDLGLEGQACTTS